MMHNNNSQPASDPKALLDALMDGDKPQKSAQFNSSWLLLGGVLIVLSGGWFAWNANWFATGQSPQLTGDAGKGASVPQKSTAPNTLPQEPSKVQARARSAFTASGYVVARRQATVSSEITGRISTLLVNEGDWVEKDQILATLEDDLAKIDLALAASEADIAQARVDELVAELDEARRSAQRLSLLFDRGASTSADLEGAKAREAALQARVAAARGQARVAQLTLQRRQTLLDRHVIRAPFSGIVTQRNAQPGEIISPSSGGGEFTRTGICTLVDMTSLQVEVSVNEPSIARIKTGMAAEVTLDAYPDTAFAARISAIVPTADRASATIPVRLDFNETDARILPEMAARVHFVQPNEGQTDAN